MLLADWIIENITGRSDPNPIFEGMNPKHRRNPEKRELFLKERIASARDKIAKSNAELSRKSGAGDPSGYIEIYAEKYYNIVIILLLNRRPKSFIYEIEFEDLVLNDLFDWMHYKQDVDGIIWKMAVEKLGTDKGVVFFIRKLFDGRFAELWSAAKARKIAKMEADAAILQQIELHRQEHRELRKLILPMANAEFLDRARLVYSIQDKVDKIVRLKRHLNAPIEDDPLDSFRGY